MTGFATEHLKFCTDRELLVDALIDAAGDYSKAVADITEVIGTIGEAQYRLMRSQVEHARMKAERAREALIAHCEDHGC